MISKKALIAGIVGLVFVVSAGAMVLQSFGTISGTASVKRPLQIYEINYNSPVNQESSGEYMVLKVNADSVNLGDWNLTTDSSSENKNNITDSVNSKYVALVDNSTVVRNSTEELNSTGIKVYDVGNLGLSNTGENVTLSYIPSSNAVVHRVDYSNSTCGGDQAYNVSSGSCDGPMLKVSAQ